MEDYLVDTDFGCYNPNNEINTFVLDVYFSNNKHKQFIKKSKDKFCKMITVSDSVKEKKITSFKLKLNDEYILNSKYEGNDIQNRDCYLEFEVYRDFLTCNCYIKKNIYSVQSKVTLFTPPNY